MKKFIDWIGCKKQLLPKILPLIPQYFKTYYEPFLGSGAVYLALMPLKAILNDNDVDLISIWQCVIADPKSLLQKHLNTKIIYINTTINLVKSKLLKNY